jgi:integrase
VAANRVLSLVKALLGFAVDRGAAEANVAAGIKPPAKEKPRDRTLTEAELRAVWGAFDRVGYPFGAMGKLLVLTAQRRGEVASMRWSQVDLDAATWRLESTDTKAGRRHVVPLSPQVIDILRALPRFAGDDRVFPAARAGSANAMSGFSKALHRIDAEVARANAERRLGRPLVKGEKPGAGEALKPWHFHDLRRTATTGMARLSIPPHICEKVLNHSAGRTLSQVARVYNVHSYGDEVRRALEAWALEVECIVTGQPAKVVAARAAAA